jgi:cytochrome c553
MLCRYGEVRIGSRTVKDETLGVMLSQKNELVKPLAQLSAGLCLVAAISVGLASCESSALQRSEPLTQTRGKALYQRDCVGCHAQYGTGDGFNAVPALAGQRFEYLREQIEHFATNERHSSSMQWAFNRASTQPLQSANDLAAYLSQLPVQRFADDDLRFHAEGEEDYLARCVACHGADARGNPAGTIPSLRAQHDAYLVNRLRQFAASSPTIRITAHTLDDHSMIAIAAYLSSLRGMDSHSTPPPPP